MSNITDIHTPEATLVDHQAVVDDYLVCWNTTDPVVREATINAVYAPEARLVDPLVDVTGHAELAGLFVHFHEAYAGCSFRQKGAIDVHHDVMRWGWEMVDADGTVKIEGLDIGTLDGSGRLANVTGFFVA